MSLLVTGSIGIDTVETPAGRRDNVLGGSAIYFSYAASFFTPVRLVGAVGDDAPKELFDVFGEQEVDTSGLEVRKGSKTFRWHGSYVQDLNEAVSIQTDLNILAEAAPKMPSGLPMARPAATPRATGPNRSFRPTSRTEKPAAVKASPPPRPTPPPTRTRCCSSRWRAA